jgi:hypothetical protein
MCDVYHYCMQSITHLMRKLVLCEVRDLDGAALAVSSREKNRPSSHVSPAPNSDTPLLSLHAQYTQSIDGMNAHSV